MGGSLRDLKRRIKSVKNTQQITKAMKMVAAAKLRRAQEAVSAARPYATSVRELVAGLASSSASANNPFFEERPEEKVLLLFLSADKGLCGGFNTNASRAAKKFVEDKTGEGVDVDIRAVGRKGADFAARRDFNVVDRHDGLMSKFTFEDSRDLAEKLIEEFLDGTYDAVYVLFMEFQSAISQIPTVTKVLPYVPEEDETAEGSGESDVADYTYEPNGEAVLSQLLPRATVALIYQYMLETSAGEHGARMAAMDNATNNAKDLIRDLTLEMNRKRQAAITTELIEIISGASAI